MSEWTTARPQMAKSAAAEEFKLLVELAFANDWTTTRPQMAREATDEELKLLAELAFGRARARVRPPRLLFPWLHPVEPTFDMLARDMDWTFHWPPGPTLDDLVAAAPLEGKQDRARHRAARRSATERTAERSAQAMRHRATLPRHTKTHSDMRAPKRRGTGRKR